MKAAIYDRPGAPDVFRYGDIPDPQVTSQDVLVRVEAISIEGADTLRRAASLATAAPHVVGYQCAGTVLAIGDRVTKFHLGERVVTVGLEGSHAELPAVPEPLCWRIPEGLSTEEAACVPIPFGTADDCLFEFGRLQPGETALIHAGAGGVGVAAIQLAKRGGARVLATASRDDKLERLSALGLDAGINYRTTDFVEEVRHLTRGRGADVIVDTLGGEILEKSLLCLAYRGRCITIGDAGRQPARPVDISGMRSENQTLVGYFQGAELIRGDRAYGVVARHLADVAAGLLRVVIDQKFPLSDAGAAHAYIESRQAFGRVVLIP